ncbi:MAG: helix-turn-helix transcriptional regulator [Cyclobacteriaceae bacterium]|nr:helix-turn-helix transcriptional regulator [Cyclobacteriaceae bacterium]
MDKANQLLIRGMVCDRCISVIKQGLEDLGHVVQRISLGRVVFDKNLSKQDKNKISKFLADAGFELITDRQHKIVSQVKKVIDDVFNQNIQYDAQVRFSGLLADTLHMNYDAISQAFSETEGLSLERYIITKRLEKVKELLVYTEFTLTEIAYITGFNSIHHLSRQFKELTGLTPSHFKSLRNEKKNLIKKIVAEL